MLYLICAGISAGKTAQDGELLYQRFKEGSNTGSTKERPSALRKALLNEFGEELKMTELTGWRSEKLKFVEVLKLLFFIVTDFQSKQRCEITDLLAEILLLSAPLRSRLCFTSVYFYFYFLFTVRSQKLLDRFSPNFQELCTLV